MSHTRQFPLPTLYPSSLQLLLSPPPLSPSVTTFSLSCSPLPRPPSPSPAVWLRVVVLDRRCCATAGTTGGSILTKAPTGVLSGGFDPQRRLYRTKIPMNRVVRGVACIRAPPSPFPLETACALKWRIRVAASHAVSFACLAHCALLQKQATMVIGSARSASKPKQITDEQSALGDGSTTIGGENSFEVTGPHMLLVPCHPTSWCWSNADRNRSCRCQCTGFTHVGR